jgi:hypothetical protein
MIFKKLLPRWLFQEFFLDWELEEWQEIYRNQTGLLSIYYRGVSRVLPQVVVFDNTIEKLGLEQVKFRLNHDKFQLDSNLKTERIFNLYKNFIWLNKRKLFNEACLRLVSIKLHQASKSVLFETQEADYFDYIQTNLCLDAQLSQENISLRKQLHIEQNSHCLEDLDKSRLANIIGINILILTSDGTLIFQRRSSRTLVRPNQICSSVSGTLVKVDIPEYDKEFNLEELLPLFFREMVEEIGLELSDISRDKIKFLGVTRELIRGGQPEIFLAAQINLDKNKIVRTYNQALDRFESKSLLFFDMGSLAIEGLDSQDKKSAFCSKFDELIENYDEAIAAPLWANLALWQKARQD